MSRIYASGAGLMIPFVNPQAVLFSAEPLIPEAQYQAPLARSMRTVNSEASDDYGLEEDSATPRG